MKPPLTPNNREELEAQVTALLLGELTDEQAAAVRAQMAQDTELAKWHDTLKQTLPVVRETVATPVGETAPQPAPLKLSPARREKLLAHFKTVAPKDFAPPSRRKTSWLVPLAAVAALVLVAVVSIPSFVASRRKSYENAVINNLRLLDSSKQQWALEQRKPSTAVPTMEDLKPYFGRGSQSELPSTRGETYFLGAVGQPPLAVVDRGGGEKALIELPGSEGGAGSTLGRKASQPNATFYADSDTRSLYVLGDDSTSQAVSEVVKLSRPASPPPAAKTPIVLPPGNADTYDAENLDAKGGLTGGTGVSEIERHLAARRSRGGAGGGGVQSAEMPAFEFNAPSSAPVQTAQAAPAPAPPTFLDLQPEESKPVETIETRTLSERERSQSTDLASRQGEGFVPKAFPTVGTVGGLVTAAPGAAPQTQTGRIPDFRGQGELAVNRDIGVQGGTAPQGLIVAGGAVPVQTALTPQAQSAAGSTLGVPVTAHQRLAQADSQDEYKKSAQENRQVETLDRLSASDAALPKDAVAPPIPQPEVQTLSNAFSTFSLNVSDVAFKLAAASLENGVMPDASSMRSEEFINAFDYRDPEPAPGASIGFAWERAADPFAHNRDFLRFSVKTAAQGRDAGRALNLVLLLDKSGSMERADRVEIIRQALTVLAGQLQARDTLSVVTFARTPRLWVDGVPGNQAGEVAKKLSDITPEGGTNLEEAMKLAYATALRHYLNNGENRVVLLTDGAANLGEVNPDVFKPWVESNRKQGIALDCFGVGWDGYNDTTLEALSRTGGGRYGFINTPEEAATDFAGQLAGALRVAASDVKVQVEFNPNRVTSYRQIGYANHQLKKEEFSDNTVAAAQIGAAESGNALYTVEVNPAGDGPLCTVRVRYRDPGTSDYHEHAWDVPYTGAATPLDKASPAMRLSASAAAFSELLGGSQFATEVTFDSLLSYLNGIPAVYGADTRPQKLEWMVRQAKSISGR